MKLLKSNNIVIVSTIIKIIFPVILRFSFPINVNAQPSFYYKTESIEENIFIDTCMKIIPQKLRNDLKNIKNTYEHKQKFIDINLRLDTSTII